MTRHYVTFNEHIHVLVDVKWPEPHLTQHHMITCLQYLIFSVQSHVLSDFLRSNLCVIWHSLTILMCHLTLSDEIHLLFSFPSPEWLLIWLLVTKPMFHLTFNFSNDFLILNLVTHIYSLTHGLKVTFNDALMAKCT